MSKKCCIFAPAIPRRGCLRVIGWGSRHIKKAFIDALFWRVETSQLSDCVQDLATVDVLRDIDYPSCAYWYAFCIYKCSRAYLNYVAREYILYSAWASRCCSIEKGNAKASKRGTTTVEIHVFCIPICVMQKEYKQLIINL